jgi:hypothetical protein
LQQPVAHDVASHTHALFKHRWPTAHEAPVPQRQVPSPQLFALVVLQLVHAAPVCPHVFTSVNVTHVVPEQHPVGHVVTSHTQLPLTQCKFDAHTLPVPHRQLPVLQLSAFAVSQVPQAPPAVPHCDVVPGATQTPPAQHPVGHDVASHTHALFKHRCPTPHAAAVPHRQLPSPQLFALVALQAVQVAPLTPHWLVVGVATQALPTQHPVAHEVASHTHAPATHLVPLAQAAFAPHRQVPLSQLSAALAVHAKQL